MKELSLNLFSESNYLRELKRRGFDYSVRFRLAINMMKKSQVIVFDIIEEISRSKRSGCLVVADPNENSISWQLYWHDNQINYATSTVGNKERLACLWPRKQADLPLPKLDLEQSEYHGLYLYWQQRQLPLSNLKKLLLDLSVEAVAQAISCGSTSIEFTSDRPPLDPIIIAYPWHNLTLKAKTISDHWQPFRSLIPSPFARLALVAKKQYDFYSFWQEANKTPEAANFYGSKSLSQWIQMLSQKYCLYQIAALMAMEPLTVARELRPLLETGTIRVLPFSEEKVAAKQVKSLTPPVVACIDDSETIQLQVKKTLEAFGYKVVNITEPSSTITKLARQKPAVILMDINMPGIDGYELCLMLQRSRKLKNVPVVMLTGQEGNGSRIKAKFVGATDYLTKPFEPQKLVSTVQRFAQSQKETKT